MPPQTKIVVFTRNGEYEGEWAESCTPNPISFNRAEVKQKASTHMTYFRVALIPRIAHPHKLGNPVLGYLDAGILIGPYDLSIIRYVHGTKAIAEFGVVFLLFNIDLEVLTATVIGLIAHFLFGHLGLASIIIGNGLALSSIAVVQE